MNLPPHAKKVFVGKIFDVYQWEQELYDGSTAIFEALRRPATIQIIPTSGDKIFLSFEEQPVIKNLSFSLLGGRIEPDEEPLVCAKRELQEEAGLESDDWELYSTYNFGGKIDWDWYIFIARNCKKTTEPNLDPGEKIEVHEVPFDKFIELASEDSFHGATFTSEILRMRLEPQKLEKFKKKLFQ